MMVVKVFLRGQLTVQTVRKAVCLIVLVFFAGCAASRPEPPDVPTGSKKEAPYDELTAAYKQLWKQNHELKRRIETLESGQKQAELEHDIKIKNLEKTIMLLEMNFNQLKSKLTKTSDRVDNLAAADFRPTDSIQEKSSEENDEEPIYESDLTSIDRDSDFETPETSSAIKSIPLIPKIGKAIPGSDKGSAAPITKVSSEPEPSGEQQTTWRDPDLIPPTDPINLTIIPGAKKQYQTAFKTYAGRNFEEAIEQFSNFLERFPNDVDADNSQYWIAQAYFNLENYSESEQALRKVIRNYEHKDTKRGYKTPDAILLLGRIYLIKDMPVKARYYFNEVIERFPDSRSAAKAKREIQSMNPF